MGGYVLVPIVHIYGHKEVRFILAQSGARVHLGRSVRPRRLPRHRRRHRARRPPTPRVAHGRRVTRRRSPRRGAALVGTLSTPRHRRNRSRGRTRRGLRAGLHVRDHERSRRASCTATGRSSRSSCTCGRGSPRISQPDGLTRHPRHRDARRRPRTHAARREHPPDRPVGPGTRPRHHARSRHRRRARARPRSSRASSSTRTSPTSTRA